MPQNICVEFIHDATVRQAMSATMPQPFGGSITLQQDLVLPRNALNLLVGKDPITKDSDIKLGSLVYDDKTKITTVKFVIIDGCTKHHHLVDLFNRLTLDIMGCLPCVGVVYPAIPQAYMHWSSRVLHEIKRCPSMFTKDAYKNNPSLTMFTFGDLAGSPSPLTISIYLEKDERDYTDSMAQRQSLSDDDEQHVIYSVFHKLCCAGRLNGQHPDYYDLLVFAHQDSRHVQNYIADFCRYEIPGVEVRYRCTHTPCQHGICTAYTKRVEEAVLRIPKTLENRTHPGLLSSHTFRLVSHAIDALNKKYNTLEQTMKEGRVSRFADQPRTSPFVQTINTGVSPNGFR